MEKRCPRQEMNKLEALLFASGEPVSVASMAKVIGIGEEDCERLAKKLMKRYETEERGMRILQLEKKFQMSTNPLYYTDIEKLYHSQQQIKLTQAQMEVMAIVAYKQPVTRQEISDIRGVASDAVIARLIQYDLIEEGGRLKAPGRPVLLRTTDEFLRHFELSSVKELPKLPKTDKKAAAKESAPPDVIEGQTELMPE